MKYNSASDPLNFDFNFAMGPMVITAKDLIADAAYNGKLSEDYVQLLPKFALQYEWRKGNNVYATVSKGYRSGGYNVQMFSDIITGQQAHSMVEAIKKSAEFEKYSTLIEGMIGDKMPAIPEVKDATTYKPEYSWNYEVGTHLTLWEGKLWADLAAFYMGSCFFVTQLRCKGEPCHQSDRSGAGTIAAFLLAAVHKLLDRRPSICAVTSHN